MPIISRGSRVKTHRIFLPLLAFVSTFFFTFLRSFWSASHCLETKNIIIHTKNIFVGSEVCNHRVRPENRSNIQNNKIRLASGQCDWKFSLQEGDYNIVNEQQQVTIFKLLVKGFDSRLKNLILFQRKRKIACGFQQEISPWFCPFLWGEGGGRQIKKKINK